MCINNTLCMHRRTGNLCHACLAAWRGQWRQHTGTGCMIVILLLIVVIVRSHRIVVLPQLPQADVGPDMHIAQEAHPRVLPHPGELVDHILHAACAHPPKSARHILATEI